MTRSALKKKMEAIGIKNPSAFGGGEEILYGGEAPAVIELEAVHDSLKYFPRKSVYRKYVRQSKGRMHQEETQNDEIDSRSKPKRKRSSYQKKRGGGSKRNQGKKKPGKKKRSKKLNKAKVPKPKPKSKKSILGKRSKPKDSRPKIKTSKRTQHCQEVDKSVLMI